MTTEAQKKAVAKYDAKNTKVYAIKLNHKTDDDIIRKLDEQDNVQGYIKKIIRKDIGE